MTSKFIPRDPGKSCRHRKNTRPGGQTLAYFAIANGHHRQVDLNRRTDGFTDAVDRGIDAQQVIIDITETIPGWRSQQAGPTAARQFRRHFQQGHDCMPYAHSPCTFRSYRRSMLLRAAPSVKMLASMPSSSDSSRSTIGEITIHHRIHQCIQNEYRPPDRSRCGSRSQRARTPKNPC